MKQSYAYKGLETRGNEIKMEQYEAIHGNEKSNVLGKMLTTIIHKLHQIKRRSINLTTY